MPRGLRHALQAVVTKARKCPASASAGTSAAATTTTKRRAVPSGTKFWLPSRRRAITRKSIGSAHARPG